MRLAQIDAIVSRPEPATRRDVVNIERKIAAASSPVVHVMPGNAPSAWRHTILRDPDTHLAIEVISVPIPPDEVPDL